MRPQGRNAAMSELYQIRKSVSVVSAVCASREGRVELPNPGALEPQSEVSLQYVVPRAPTSPRGDCAAPTQTAPCFILSAASLCRSFLRNSRKAHAINDPFALRKVRLIVALGRGAEAVDGEFRIERQSSVDLGP